MNAEAKELAPIEPTTKRERELRDRAVRDYAALQAVCLDTTQTFFAPSTEATIAKKNGTLAKKRRDHAALDLAHDGLDRLVQRVLDEDRRTIEEAFRQHACDMEATMSVLSRAERVELIRLLKKVGLFAAE